MLRGRGGAGRGSISRFLELLMCLSASVAFGGLDSLEGQELLGRVGSAEGPVAFAEVLVVDADGRVLRASQADSNGRFVLEGGGWLGHYLYVEALGYLAAYEGPLQATALSPLQIVLAKSPVVLEGIEVYTEARDPFLARTGFYERRASGQGVGLDAQDVARRESARVFSDLLRGLPGVSVDSRGYVRLRGMSSFTGRTCYYRVYLDGVLFVDRGSWDEEWARTMISPDHVMGVEVYRRPVEVPVQFGGASAGCGVILVWSKR